MTRQELINKIAEKTGMTKKDSKVFLEGALEAILEGVVEDGQVHLVGFGNFELTESTEREGRNPQTGEAMVIPAKKRMTFKCSKAIKDTLNA